ncbi:TPA_asm: coat protein [ssRNA phage Gerhypos.4_30]|uniref:Coat protein n=2 Tax=Fiersviridae TaxID=2842319 RepID=A0A8S5L0B2_9VIRU|nr:coat protein [ssRNA phage Gerhypos.4_30]QDH86630.1 MAG: hypothetical protein H4Bulk46582_000002 [Leviviridae sp.]DAD51374.1 TPA_asm: coat protein [ssRNA phage Gerhypos.4_30]
MAASNIVLADAQATPVNHTFVPMGPDANRVFWFEDQSQATPNGFWRISVSLKRPPPATSGTSANGRSFRVSIQLNEPVLETLGTNTVSGIPPAPTVAYIPRGTVEYVLPERAVLQNRKDLRKMLASLLAETQMTAVVETLTMPF